MCIYVGIEKTVYIEDGKIMIDLQYTLFTNGWSLTELGIKSMILFGRYKFLSRYFFLWLVKQKRVLTRVNLSKRGRQRST